MTPFRLLVLACLLLVVAALILAATARAHFVPGRHNAIHAVQLVWCGKSNLHCPGSVEAVRVMVCEAGPYWDWNIPAQARNGQYLGILQMGDWERHRFGHGPDPWSQARAAHRYWLLSGWHPWECQP